MSKYKEMFSPKEWQNICDEVNKERFIADYSYCINEEPVSFKPRTQEEREYFDEAYYVYLERRGIDIADCEAFGYVRSEMTKRGWVSVICPHCQQVIIVRVTMPKEAGV